MIFKFLRCDASFLLGYSALSAIELQSDAIHKSFNSYIGKKLVLDSNVDDMRAKLDYMQ